MSIEHQDVRLLLGAYVLGALDDPDKRRVQEHLPRCEVCRDEAGDLALLPELLRRRTTTHADPRVPAVPPQLLPDLLRQVAARRRQERRQWVIRAAVAAVTVAALTLGGGALLTRERSPAGERIDLVSAFQVAGDPDDEVRTDVALLVHGDEIRVGLFKLVFLSRRPRGPDDRTSRPGDA